MFRGTVDTTLIGDDKIADYPKLWDRVLAVGASDDTYCINTNTAEAPTVTETAGTLSYTAASGSKKGCLQMSMTKDSQKVSKRNFI